MKKQRKAYTVAEREMQIIGAIAVNVQRGGSWWLTTADLARYLKITPSTHLRLILADMVAKGKLSSRREKDPGIAGYRRLYTVDALPLREAIKKARLNAGADFSHVVKINSRQASFLERL